MKTIKSFTLLILLSIGSVLHAAETWDIIDKSMAAWNTDGDSNLNKAWSLSKTYLTATQEEDYVNLKKSSGADGFIIPQTFTIVNTNTYTIDVKVQINAPDKASTATAFEANQISIRMANKLLRLYLKHGDADNGYIAETPAYIHDEEDKYVMNTSAWHVYRFVFNISALSYDVYVDNMEEPAFSGLKPLYDNGANTIKIGSDKDQFCNMNVEYVKAGTGNFALCSQINGVVVSSDSHIVDNARTITATVNTDLVEDGTKVFLGLYDENDIEKVAPKELTITGNTIATQFTIPASLPKGKYFLKAFVLDNKIGTVNVKPKTKDYCIVGECPITTGVIPPVEVQSFIIETGDYLYKAPTNEYIFPVVVDTKKHLNDEGKFSDGTEPLNRYYWLHTPHDDPGGMFLYTSASLDGPWTEHGVIMSNDWARANGINTSHISSCHIIWNDVFNKYFMYFHGDNNRTNYATSDNLIDWTYGDKVVGYENFSFSAREASYARVFDYEVPGYNNKYIMVLMVNENNSRTIFWAHSTDGISWKGVKKPLVSAKLNYKKVPGTNRKPSYADNVSGPYFMNKDGRQLVLFHSTTGHIAVVEVGEKFDMEVHWGEYLKSTEAVIVKNGDEPNIAVSRVASPFFIQDDLGTWYLFFEAGTRLGANTAYAKGETPTIPSAVTLTINDNVYVNEQITFSASSQNVTDPVYTYSVKLPDSEIYVTTTSPYQPTVAGTYTFKVEVAETGAEGIILAEDEKNVLVKDIPTVTLTITNNVFVNEQISFNATSENVISPVYTYSVKLPDSETYVTTTSPYQPTVAGTYTFKVEVAESNSSSNMLAEDEKNVLVKDVIISLNDKTNDYLSVYKTETGVVLTNKTNISGAYQLYDLTGRLMQTGIINEGDNIINIDKGVYILNAFVDKNYVIKLSK